METKKELRHRFLELRDSLSQKVRDCEERNINRHILESSFFEEADILFAFASYGSETDTFFLVNQAFRCGKRVCFPLVLKEGMEFYEVRAVTELQKGYKGILEPASDTGKVFVPKEGEHILMLMPGICFDRAGGRIGYGGGFYDRYLEKCERRGKMPVMIAPAYQCQLADVGIIPVKPYDIGPDYVVTTDGFLQTKKLMLDNSNGELYDKIENETKQMDRNEEEQ